MMEAYTDPPSILISSFDGDLSESAAEIVHALSLKEEIHDSIGEEEEIVIEDEAEEEEEEEVEEDDEEEEEEEEEEFSFVLVGSDSTPITADDAFQNGQIRSFFPIFDQSLLYDGVSAPNRDDLPHLLPVNKVFIETEESISPAASAAGNGEEKREISGPYCTWSRKAVEATVSASPEVCKKSNSTGFSKLWRFHDLLNRSNSDGKDAYVFLNRSSASRSKATSEKRQAAVSSTAAAAGEKIKPKAKKGVKSAALKAHEKYLRSKEEDRRRSYLPYRPELMGFFTNIHGGMTKNVHPF